MRQVFRGKDQTSLGQLIHLPWTRQLALCEGNGQLPGLTTGSDPSENLLWVLLGFDPHNLVYPVSLRFNSEDSACVAAPGSRHVLCFSAPCPR